MAGKMGMLEKKINTKSLPLIIDTNLYFGDLLVVNSHENNLINFTQGNHNSSKTFFYRLRRRF